MKCMRAVPLTHGSSFRIVRCTEQRCTRGLWRAPPETHLLPQAATAAQVIRLQMCASHPRSARRSIYPSLPQHSRRRNNCSTPVLTRIYSLQHAPAQSNSRSGKSDHKRPATLAPAIFRLPGQHRSRCDAAVRFFQARAATHTAIYNSLTNCAKTAGTTAITVHAEPRPSQHGCAQR